MVLKVSERAKLVAFWVLLPGAAFGQVMTGNDILAICTSDDLAQSGACAGYVVGVNEGLIAGAAVPLYAVNGQQTAEDINSMTSVFLRYCLPPEVEARQLLDVMVLNLQAHPESRHMPARGLYLMALQEAFPCAPQ
jgi:hypothetical protein